MAREYDLLVIGGGSGGLAHAQRAAEYGARAGVIEYGPLGGTCVNVGCVPKKVMWYAAETRHHLEHAADYGFDIDVNGHDWASLKTRRDAYVTRLNDIYERNLDKRGVEYIQGAAQFVDPHTLAVGGEHYHAERIAIATGGRPMVPDIPGAGYGIVSDGFFTLGERPQRVLIAGSGYIAVELGGVFNALGSDVNIVVRKDGIVRSFDAMLGDEVMLAMQASGIRFEAAGVQTDDAGFIPVDKFQATNIEHIFALGDVTGAQALTPVAIAAGRRLADRIYGGMEGRHLDYRLVPTVIFSHPPMGTVGMTEAEARAEHGDAVKVYLARFTAMYYALGEKKQTSVMKLITAGDDEHVVGCHVIGDGADEMMQGFAVAIRMGATKKDFDDTVAIHPTSAEEFVTMR